MGYVMKVAITIISLITGALILLALTFGDLPTIALSTDIEDVKAEAAYTEERLETKIAANEAFMLDESIDRLQDRIWSNKDRQQTYRDKSAPIPSNLKEQLRGLESVMKKLQKRRDKLQ